MQMTILACADSIDTARIERDKRLGILAKICCINEPSRSKAWGSSRSLQHRKTIQGQMLVQVAICLTIPVDEKMKCLRPTST